MFEIKAKEVIKASIYGEIYELKKPTYGMVEKLNAEMSGKELQDQMRLMRGFVAELGLPDEVIEGMELEHFNALVGHITGAKKN